MAESESSESEIAIRSNSDITIHVPYLAWVHGNALGTNNIFFRIRSALCSLWSSVADS